MNLAQLNAHARAIRQKPVGVETRAELDALRESADPGALAAFDLALGSLFADVYGGSAPPPLSVTSSGPALNAAHGGTRDGAVISFSRVRDPTAIVAAVSARVPELRTTTPPPMPIEAQFKLLQASERDDAKQALAAELRAVPVWIDGERGTLLEKLEQSGLNADRMLDVLAQVKLGYERVSAATGDKPPGYQEVNWKHTRLELARILDVVENAKLTPAEAETALYASCLSDAVKAPSNFLVHNVHGAQAALHVLSRLLPPPSTEMIEDVVKATLEHQIGPPGFMANVAMANALRGAGVDKETIASITAKIAKPFESARDGKIPFSDVEQEALAKVGVFAWTVPQEGTRHYRAARAVIDADSLVNYACPDGWAKLAALHGPDQPPFLQEPRLADGLLSMEPQHASAIRSYYDAKSVVSPASMKLYEAGLLRTKLAIDRVMKDLERFVASIPPQQRPRTRDGKTPYLNGALDYTDALQLHFARRLREQAVTLLRQQENV